MAVLIDWLMSVLLIYRLLRTNVRERGMCVCVCVFALSSFLLVKALAPFTENHEKNNVCVFVFTQEENKKD